MAKRFKRGDAVRVPSEWVVGHKIVESFNGTVESTHNGGRQWGNKLLSVVIDENGVRHQVFTRFLHTKGGEVLGKFKVGQKVLVYKQMQAGIELSPQFVGVIIDFGRTGSRMFAVVEDSNGTKREVYQNGMAAI